MNGCRIAGGVAGRGGQEQQGEMSKEWRGQGMERKWKR